MALTREQYDSILLRYTQKQDLHRRQLEKRRREVYLHVPEYRTLDEEVPAQGMALLRARLAGKDTSSSPLKEDIAKVTVKKEAMLTANGYPADYLSPVYDCPDCKDTGFIDGKKCHCFRAQETAILYDQSGIQDLAKQKNFSSLSDDFYQGDDYVWFQKRVQDAKEFVRCFPKSYRNFYYYGNVGTGKTFLSICIAHELIEKGYSVLYFSAVSLFEKLSSYTFNIEKKHLLRELQEDLYNCDLLIIDDLGAELANNYVNSALFSCLNERDLRRKSTIISSNKSLNELRMTYSERISSRISGQYEICKFTGPDLRVVLRRRSIDSTRK